MSIFSGSDPRPSQRAAQKAATRERIVDALVAQLVDDAEDLSVGRLADAAGVSVRTVYVHFPDREALLAALDERVNVDLVGQPAYATPEDLATGTGEEFRQASANADVLLAQMRTRLGRELRARSRPDRARRVRASLAPLLDALPPDEADEVLAVFLLLRGADAWKVLHADLGLDADACARAITWTLETLVADLRRRTGVEG